MRSTCRLPKRGRFRAKTPKVNLNLLSIGCSPHVFIHLSFTIKLQVNIFAVCTYSSSIQGAIQQGALYWRLQ
jgi:hypothetical protein